jgi:RNA polymerase sigma factor (sigma-70 family)
LHAAEDIPDWLLEGFDEFGAEATAPVGDFAPVVQQQYGRIRQLCRAATQDTGTAEDIAQKVFHKFFQQIWEYTNGGEVRGFASPEAWLTRVAKNACADFGRERSRRLYGERPRKNPEKSNRKARFTFPYVHELQEMEDEDGLELDVIECAVHSGLVRTWRNPEENAFDREILMRYLSALCRLTPLQRLAYVLCKDKMLQAEEQEQLLHACGSIAEMVQEVISGRPDMRIGEIAYLLGIKEGTFSSELTRARARLQVELADLRWRKPCELPVVQTLSREFIVGFSGKRGSFGSLRMRLEEPTEPEQLPWFICERDKDFVRTMPGPKRKYENIRPHKQEGVQVYSMNVKPGWAKVPEADHPDYVSLLNRIRDLLRARKKWTTIAKELNAAHIPSRFGQTWHPSGVRLFAERARLVEKRRKSVAPKDVLDKIRELLAGTKKWATIAQELNAANVLVPLGYSQTWHSSAVRVIAQRAGLARKRSKLIAPKKVLNRIHNLLKARKKWTTIAKRLNRAKVRVPPGFGRTWSPRGVKLIAQRAGLVRKHRKSTAPTDVLDEIRDQLKAKKKWITIAERLNRAKVHVPPSFGKTWYAGTVKAIANDARLINSLT